MTANGAQAQNLLPADHSLIPQQLAAGGEGGEGGEAGHAHSQDAFSALPADQALAGRLTLMQGHLKAARTLYEMGRIDDAYGHYSHPREELYASIAGDLKRRGIKGLDRDLTALV